MAPRERPAATVLDDVSKAIIEQLQQDGRRPYASIGKAVGLSEAAVRQRVQRLQEAGIMQIVAVTDPMQLGFSRAAMIGVRVEGDVEAVAGLIEAMAEVEELPKAVHRKDVHYPDVGSHLVAKEQRAVRIVPIWICASSS